MAAHLLFSRRLLLAAASISLAAGSSVISTHSFSSLDGLEASSSSSTSSLYANFDRPTSSPSPKQRIARRSPELSPDTNDNDDSFPSSLMTWYSKGKSASGGSIPDMMTGRRPIDAKNKPKTKEEKAEEQQNHPQADLTPVHEEFGHSTRNSAFYAVSTSVGRRQHMEDVHDIVMKAAEVESGMVCDWFAIFDGHGGRACAEYARANLLKHINACPHANASDLRSAITASFARVDSGYFHECTGELYPELGLVTNHAMQRRYNHQTPGSTALCMLLCPKRLVVMNMGDSRAVMFINGSTVQLSTDHKAADQKEVIQIRNQGSFVDEEGYIEGRLNISRSFGDFDLKPPLSVVPEIREVTLSRQTRSVVVVASDGLWDALSNQQACGIAWEALNSGKTTQDAADLLVSRALTEGTMDNVTVMVIDLQPIHASAKRSKAY